MSEHTKHPAHHTDHHPAHHPSQRHPLTVARVHKYMPIVAGGMGLVIGLGVFLAWQQNRIDMVAGLAPRHARVVSADMSRTDLYEIKLGAVQSIEKDPAFTPAPDQDIVIIPVTLTNHAKTNYQFLPALSTYIRDEEGGIYKMHPTVYLKNPLPAGDVAAGATVSGELSYAIPKTLKSFKFYVDAGWGDMAPAVFYIKR
jgi:hypothetical protein